MAADDPRLLARRARPARAGVAAAGTLLPAALVRAAVGAAPGAHRVRTGARQPTPVLPERTAVPDLVERLLQHVPADQVEAGRDVPVGEDVRADPRAARRHAVREPLRLSVVDLHLLARQLRIDDDRQAVVPALQ